jgi:hypothetical protein
VGTARQAAARTRQWLSQWLLTVPSTTRVRPLVRLSEPVRNLCPALRTTAKRPSLPRWQWSMQCCSAAVSSVLPSPRAAHVASQDAVGSVAGSGPGSRGTARAARARLPRSPEGPSTTRRARARAGAGAAAARGRASPSRAPARCCRCWRLPVRQELDRVGQIPHCIYICPWCSPALDSELRNSPFSIRLRLNAARSSRIRAHRRLPSRPRQRLGFAE